MKYLLPVILLYLIHTAASAQNLSNIRTRLVAPYTDTLKLSDELIVPASVRLVFSNGHTIPADSYHFDYKKNTLFIKQSSNDSLFLIYRISSSEHLKPYALHYPPSDSIKPVEREQNKNTELPRDGFLSSSNIQKSGSITRGITVGTNSDPGLNSQMSLQLSGEAAPGIFLNAALSDDNIPVQPDGSTQNIRELDRILVEINNEKHRLSAGDIVADNSSGMFLKSKKKAQGLQYQYLHDKDSSIAFKVDAAVGKGKFRRMKFNAVEGNQGPYRLTGENNESYIIVLAGSERIFVDGVQIDRGEDRDYTINYNTAELSFTARFPVGKDSRIIAEFEYSERNYTRFVSGSTLSFKRKRNLFHFGVLSENDAKNQSLSGYLNDSLKTILRNAGDDPSKAVILSETRIDSAVQDRIAYRKTDTIVYNKTYNDIYVYKPIAEIGDYYVEFSYVGENKGHYIRKAEAVNGKVFQWVPPVDGLMQGNYAPVKQLISPKSQTLINAGGSSQIGEHHSADYELAVSHNDQNLFSDDDDSNNTAYALRLETHSQTDSSAKHQIRFNSRYIHTAENFETFQNFRPPEFERDYNAPKLNAKQATHLAGADVAYMRKDSKFELSGNYFLVPQYLSAGQYAGAYNYSGEKFQTTHKISYLSAEEDQHHSKFLRYRNNADIHFKPFILSLNNEGERNLFRAEEKLDSASYRFNLVSVGIKSHNKANLPFHISLSQREDFSSSEQDLQYLNQTIFARAETQLINKEGHSLKLHFNYRLLKGADSLPAEGVNRKNPSGQINYRLNALHNFLNITALIEHKTGSRMKKDFKYVEVATGQGQYVWEDFNENTIREIDEFVLSAFPAEANYIRVQLPTDEYRPVYEQKMDMSLTLTPSRLPVRTESIALKIIRPFSLQSTFSNHRAFRTEAMPAQIQLDDSLFNEKQENLMSKLFFRSPNGFFYSAFIYKNTGTLYSHINGITQQKNISRQFESTFFFKKLRITPVVAFSNENYVAEFPQTGNYNLRKHDYRLTAKLFPGSKIELRPQGNLSYKSNQLGEEDLRQYELGIAVQSKPAAKAIAEAELKYTNNRFSGNESTATAYKMMNGLKDGNNLSWNTKISLQISEYLELNIFYSGRHTPSNKAIHTGNISVSALF